MLTNFQDRNRVQFTIGDACDLPLLGEFGCLFSSNMLCTIKYPRKFLENAHKYVVPGGTLVMAENYMRHGDSHEVFIGTRTPLVSYIIQHDFVFPFLGQDPLDGWLQG